MEQPPSISEFKSKSGLGRILKAFNYSMAGLKTAWQTEHAFRQELILVAIGIVVAVLLPIAAYEKLGLMAVLILVLIVELMNSAIEAVVDRVSLERHALSKNAKDGSAAVLLSLMLAGMTWVTVLYQNFV
jgi:diacylglycerol kinase (ATP)